MKNDMFFQIHRQNVKERNRNVKERMNKKDDFSKHGVEREGTSSEREGTYRIGEVFFVILGRTCRNFIGT